MKKSIKILQLFLRVLPRLNNKDIFFIFPFYHMGGAEAVHLAILKVFSDRNIACLITNDSVNDQNKKDFMKYAALIEINDYTRKRKVKAVLARQISRKINQSKKPVVFGCNSHFFYDLIPFFEPHVKVIDLIHAFSYEEPYAAEKYSLPYVARINKRVVLGAKTLSDFNGLYRDNAIDLKFLDNIHIIKNSVKTPEEYPVKPHNEKLKILFVGRNGYEKRPELFFTVAAKCEHQVEADFFVIGDFDTNLKSAPNVKIVGEIYDSEKLNQYYLNSDLILITSSREGFPMVVIEGMALGVVPVCTDVGEIKDFINEENENGFIIENSEDTNTIVNDFVELIKKLMHDRVLLSKRSVNAHQTVKSAFKHEIFASKYVDLIDN